MTAGGKVVVFGAGSLAQVVDHYLHGDSLYEVVAFTVTSDRLAAERFLDRPVVPFEQVVEQYPPSDHAMFVAVGYDRMNRVRRRFYDDAKAKGYRLPGYISSKALVDGASVGENCLILAGAMVEPFATIGDDVIVWSGAHVCHHSSIGDHSFLGPDVAVASHTTVGQRCFLGVHATVRDSITVADDCLIGAGANVLRDTTPGQVLVGSAARLYPGDVSRFFD